jgi:hypothetical protein
VTRILMGESFDDGGPGGVGAVVGSGDGSYEPSSPPRHFLGWRLS